MKKRILKKSLVISIMLLFIGIGIVPATGTIGIKQSTVAILGGDTLYVGGSGSNNYTKIQDAIDDASDRDTVFVYNGTYDETITIDIMINLIGEDKITTFIYGSESGTVVTINADQVNISGFTVGKSGSYYFDAGVEVHSNYSIISNNCMLFNPNRGIYLSYSSNNIISGNIIYHSVMGILTDYSDNNIISGNDLAYNDYGIAIRQDSNYNDISDNRIISSSIMGTGSGQFSHHNNITNNSIFYCKDGVRFVSNSNDNIISGNVIGYSRIGIKLEGPTSDNIIYGNKITNSTNYGIFGQDRCNFNIISSNDISSSSNHGLWLTRSCHNNTISDNNFNSNGFGIRIESSKYPSNNNIIHHNNFINNTYGAYDECNNTWDNGYPSGGNYWDDYSGVDNFSGPNQDIPGSDGIGDTPKKLSPWMEKDWYPLMYLWGEQRPIVNYTYSILDDGGILFDGSSSYDRDGVIVLYEWDFDDGNNDQGVVVSHGYNESGTYDVTLTATDDDGYQGSYTRSIEAEKNYPPSAPLIDGPIEAKAGKSHFYNFTSEDPEEADVSYYIEWGDGRVNPWCDFLSSGETYRTNHGWAKGTYMIRCKAKDIYGAESNWSELEVTMPLEVSLSSTENTVESEHSYHRSLKSVDNSKEILSWGKIAFGLSEDPFWNEYRPCYIELNDPQNITWFGSTESKPFFSGGTWTNDGRWIVCEYYTGALWEIDPTNGDIESIGGGGAGLNGLAYNPSDSLLYGASGSGLYIVNIETGKQEYVGSFGVTTLMIAIAFDAEGVLYGWAILPDNLYTIDTDTGECTEVGPLGINLNFAQDGAFEFEDDILYLAAYTTDGPALYKCDEDTGNCTLVGPLGAALCPFAIPYVLSYTPHDPININGNDNFTSENGVTGGSGTYNNPYIIQGWDINASSQHGITVSNVNVYFNITNCYIHTGGIARDGIVFKNVTNGVIEDSIITDNRYGIIFLGQGDPWQKNSSYNTIHQNNITYNTKDGIHFEHLGSSHHSHNLIYLNNITGNNRGIYMVMSAYNHIFSNNIISNKKMGVNLSICMGGGKYNKVFHNNFIDNGDGQACVWGYTLDNDWDDGYPSGGNFWSDYDGVDNFSGPNQNISGSDGIGDTPYNISTYDPWEDDYDYYPLMEPWGGNLPPFAKFSWTPMSPDPEETILFNASESIDYDGNITLYEWDWDNDGEFDENHTNSTATHSWSSNGYYPVTLRVTDNDNLTDRKTKTVRVSTNGITLYVGGSGAGNYTKIQDAIDDSSDGDTVFVYDDSSPYYENIVVYKSINLIGENKRITIISGNAGGSVVYVSVDWVNISGFTIRNSRYPHCGISISSNYNNITGNTISNNNDGICLYSSSNKIMNNSINSNNGYGLQFQGSNTNTIIGNAIRSNNRGGIWLYKSSSNNITGNAIYSNNWDGISLHYSSSNNITGNAIRSNNRGGISLQYSSSNKIMFNGINSNNGYGLQFYSSNTNTIIGNDIYSNNRGGISLHYSSSNNITGNAICSNNWDGIWLYYSSSNNITGNDIYSNNGDGIWLYNSSSNNITGNAICSNNWEGISLHYSSNNITGNAIYSNNRDGISLHYSSSNNITGNIITGNEYGLQFYSSNTNTITGNAIHSNNRGGIFLHYSSSNNITGNDIYSNNRDGIWLYNSSNNNITGNNISNNNMGISLGKNSNSNTILKNNFLNNQRHASFRKCRENTWEQNYWNRPRILPKLIFGTIEIGSKEIPWVNFDWHPAQEPYDIGV